MQSALVQLEQKVALEFTNTNTHIQYAKCPCSIGTESSLRIYPLVADDQTIGRGVSPDPLSGRPTGGDCESI